MIYCKYQGFLSSSNAKLFEVQKPAISKHIYNIYEIEELNKKTTVSNLEIVQAGQNALNEYEIFNK